MKNLIQIKSHNQLRRLIFPHYPNLSLGKRSIGKVHTEFDMANDRDLVSFGFIDEPGVRYYLASNEYDWDAVTVKEAIDQFVTDNRAANEEVFRKFFGMKSKNRNSFNRIL
jgi:hypothetical protein